MNTSKDDPDAECRKLLAPLADRLARTDPEERRRLVASLLPQASPTILRLLAGLLVRRLDYKDERVCSGAADALALFGPRVLATVQWALVVKPTERCLLRLAAVAVGISRDLSTQERTMLTMALAIAAGRAPTPVCRVALEGAARGLHERDVQESEAGRDEAKKRAAE
jgi:hypothetical protein